LLWGTEPHLRQLLGRGIAELRVVPRHFVFRYRSAEHFLQVFRTFYGPVLKAFETVGDAGRDALAADLLALLEQHNTASGHLVIPSEYLEIVATRSAA
jgi:hypothetical protein